MTRKPYSIARAELIADQIARFATQHLHQLAGHHANLAFWLAEASAALATIDEYQHRLRQLRSAQLAWVQDHRTKITRLCPICRGPCEFGPASPDRPHRIPSKELDEARTAVRSAVRSFLLRLFQAGFVSEAEARDSAALIGAAVDSEDFELSETQSR